MKRVYTKAGRRYAVGRLLLLGAVCWLTVGCARLPSSTPTVYKMGLIAPFEGLYRNTGYAALNGLRLAIQECSPDDKAFIPLALDDSYRAPAFIRAAGKLDQDPRVTTWLGPLAPHLLSAGGEITGTSGLMPFLMNNDDHFAASADWPQAMAHYIRSVADELTIQPPSGEDDSNTHTRLLVVVSEQGMAQTGELGPTAIPVIFIANTKDKHDERQTLGYSGEHADESVSDFAVNNFAVKDFTVKNFTVDAVMQVYLSGDALLWLEPDPTALASLAQLRTALPHLPLMVGPDPGLALHLAAGEAVHAPLHWAVWSNAGFSDWALRHKFTENRSPGNARDNSQDDAAPWDDLPAQTHAHAVYLVYTAACAGLQDGHAHENPQSGAWRVRLLPIAGAPIAGAPIAGLPIE